MDGEPTLREYLETLLRAERAEIETARLRDEQRYVTTERYDQRHEDLEVRLGRVEQFAANITGRLIGLGAIGILFTAVVASAITRLLLGTP